MLTELKELAAAFERVVAALEKETQDVAVVTPLAEGEPTTEEKYRQMVALTQKFLTIASQTTDTRQLVRALNIFGNKACEIEPTLDFLEL